MSDSDIDGPGVPLLESLSPSPAPTSSKRKANDDDGPKPSKRSAKRKKAHNAQADTDEGLDLDAGIDLSIGQMDSQLLADHIAQRTKRFQSDLSLVELEDIRIPASLISDTSDFSSPRSTDNLAAFLEQYATAKGSKDHRLTKAPKENGSPHTIVVAASGLRAADLTRALRKFQTKDCAVAKLFAKHIKIKEAIEMAGKTRMGIGVGTPQRLMDLLTDGALRTASLQRVIIDASHIDMKKRGVMDMRETHGPLVKLLNRGEIKERMQATNVQCSLMFY